MVLPFGGFVNLQQTWVLFKTINPKFEPLNFPRNCSGRVKLFFKSWDVAWTVNQLGFVWVQTHGGFRSPSIPAFEGANNSPFAQVGGPLTGREGTGGLLAQFQAPEVPKDFYSQVHLMGISSWLGMKWTEVPKHQTTLW